MVQPYDYSLGTPSTTESFLAGVQSYQNQQKVDAARAAGAADQAKVDQTRNFSLEAQEVAKNPTPEKLSALYAKYPLYGADLDRFSKSLASNDRRTYGTILNDAIIAKDSDKTPEEVAGIYTKGAEAARNSNRPDIADKFDAAAKMALNPNMNDNFAARSLYNVIDPEGYKLIVDSAVKLDTSTVKNLIAEGFVPGTQEFKDALKRERTKITTTLPGDGFYSGSEEGLRAILGGQLFPSNVQKGPPLRPTTKEEFDKLPPGAIFIDPNGVTREKPGGQTSTTQSGDFR